MFKHPFWNLRIGKFYCSIGWYRGEPFKVLSLELGEVDNDLVRLFSFQAAYFCFAFGFDL